MEIFSSIVTILQCFFLDYGLKININKSRLLGVGVPFDEVETVACLVGCVTFKTPFVYVGSMVGGSMNRLHSWSIVVQ